MKLGIVDYGLGNIRSIQNMLQRLGVISVVSADPDELLQAERLILPGVGHFKYGMEQLQKSNLVNCLNQRVLVENIPILGICLGAQMMGRHSQEGGIEGLGWIDMDVVAFDNKNLTTQKVPHMGWTETVSTLQHPLFKDMPEDPSRFYYVHSYHFESVAVSQMLCTASYGYLFTTGYMHKNITGVQFHPEKSHAFGMQFMKNWLEMDFSEP